MTAIRAHKGVRALKKAKKAEPPLSPSSEMSLQESLKAQLAKRREAFGGGSDLTSLSNLIPEPEMEPGFSSVYEGKIKCFIGSSNYVINFLLGEDGFEVEKASNRLIDL